MKKTFLLIAFVFMCAFQLQAQVNISIGGGFCGGSFGGTSVSFSLGDFFARSDESSPIPYEIYVSGVDSYPSICLTSIVTPDSPQGNLQLVFRNSQLIGEARVYDAEGNYLFTNRMDGPSVNLNLGGYAPGTYFVNVFSGEEMLKSFKVVKN